MIFLDTLFRTDLIVKDTNLANQYLKRGWEIKRVDTEYWPTQNGGFDSRFIFEMQNKSRVIRFVAKYVNGFFFKRSVL